jgi:hypothetical protein
VLAPPKEQGNFKLFLYSNDKPNQYGEILGSICDDYDYKLVARADKNQNVNIEIFRNEYDIETIPQKVNSNSPIFSNTLSSSTSLNPAKSSEKVLFVHQLPLLKSSNL